MRKIDADTREVIDILTALRAYEPALPDASPFATAGARKTKKLRDALAFAKSRKKLSFKAEGELCPMLAEALPQWPSAYTVSFARNFHELVHGRTPTRKMMDLENGEVYLEPVIVRGETH